MRIYFFVLLSLFFLYGHTQTKITGYQYWFDDQVANAVKQNITAVENYTFNAQVNTAQLLYGLHLFNINFTDDSSRVSTTSSQFFYKPVPSSSTTNITEFQYWFDGDGANAVTQNVSAIQEYTFAPDINAGNLLTGIHVLQVRFKDNNNRWSETVSYFFYKPGVSGSNNIIAYQYWFDQSVAGAVQQNISPTTLYTLSSPLDATTLLPGLHVLNVRFLDSKHQWSSAVSQYFYKAAAIVNNNITRFQYWFDQDFSGAVEQTITPSATYDLSEQLSTTALLNGLHALSIKFSDATGKWSSTATQFFYKEKNESITENKISGYRYWFNEGDSSMNLVDIVPFMNPVLLNEQIAADGLDSGKHVIHFQFRDSNGIWSMVSSDSALVNAKTIYTFRGNGNWSNTANWVNKIKPPLNLSGTYKIFIDPVAGGQCILDVNQQITTGAIITVRTGKSFVISGNLNLTQ